MKYKKNISVLRIFCVSFLTLFLAFPITVHADSSQPVRATINLSICGNTIAENGEDCDNADLAGKSCQSLGYGGGVLTCDISCSYETSACTAVVPTQAAPTPTVIPAVVTSSLSPSVVVSLPVSTPVLTVIHSPTQFPTAFSGQQSVLPIALKIYDVTGSGKIQTAHLYQAVKLWVDEWKKSSLETSQQNNKVKLNGFKNCDVNKDTVCDLEDFSILMFYIER